MFDAVEGSAGQSPAQLIAARGPLIDGLERFLNGERGISHDPASEFQGAGQGRARLCEVIDETCGMGSLGTDRVAGQDQLSCEIEWQRIRSAKQRGASRKHTDRDLGQSETSRPRRNDEIAGEDDLEPTAQGGAFDGRHQRLAPHSTNDAVFAAAFGDVVAVAGEVAAGAEDRIGSSQHARPERIVVIELIQRRIELVRHFAIDGVSLGLPTHRDDQQMIFATSFDTGSI